MVFPMLMRVALSGFIRSYAKGFFSICPSDFLIMNPEVEGIVLSDLALYASSLGMYTHMNPRKDVLTRHLHLRNDW